jgi:hypothetical protein
MEKKKQRHSGKVERNDEIKHENGEETMEEKRKTEKSRIKKNKDMPTTESLSNDDFHLLRL